MPTASEAAKPAGLRSTALAAVPDQSNAWFLSPVDDPLPKPTCWPPKVPSPIAVSNPDGVKSTKPYVTALAERVGIESSAAIISDSVQIHRNRSAHIMPP